ncbi:hypothetical protein BOX15_Mlig016419g3 [Macrostomum lignano]|uniref:Fibronectin type-III domain-containing protein n=1 Tax=Macrostomum lignano TaxID=282301 RepID=A0A267DT99_9PLAT|nr:hypothetical protein BOX15_Mlig016419g3 [Macrostomum lignano]
MGSAPSQSRPQSAAATDSSSGLNQTSKPPPPPASRTVSARSYADRGRSATAVQHLTIMPNRQYSPEQLENRMKWRDDPSEIVSVTINQSGFSKTSVNIVTGNFVAFSWNIADSEVATATEPSLGCNVTQVVHDGEQFRPVPGGIHSGQLTARGNFSHRFGIVGEFTFVCAGIRCQPLTVRVSERPPFQIEFAADRGFSVESADLEAGESVKWLWRDLPAEMRVLPAELCINCGLRQSDGSGSESKKNPPTCSGSFEQQFNQPGIYYFVTESSKEELNGHLSTVRVRDCYREHRVRIRDDGFDPPITFISVGDRVWFEWGGGGSDICQFRHAPFEISADRSGPEFKPTQAAYRWQRASRCGLMAHDFLRIIKPDATCYVSHFADLSAATVGKLRRRSGKLGSIVVSVRPAQVEVRVDEAGRFQPDFLSLSVGDSVLLELQGEANKRLTDLKLVGGTALSNDEVENWRKLGNSGDDGESFGCSDCKQLKPATAKQLPQVSAIFLNSKCCSTPMGVRHFRWHGNDDNVLSVISRPGCQTRTVRLTDSGSFEPSEIFVQPGDSLLCSWQTGRRTLQFADTIGEVDESSTDTDSQQKLGQSIDGPCVLSFHLPELSDRSDAASDNRVHRSRFDLTSDSGSQLRVHRRSTAGQRQIRLMDLTTKSVSRTTVLAQLGDLAVWMFNSPDDAVKAVQSLNAKSLDVKSRIVEQCLDSPGPVTVSNVSLFVAQDADRSMQELDFDATVGMSVSTGKVRPSLVTVPRGGCVLISLTGSINSEQPNSELHKIDNDGKKSANKQNNEDGVKIDKINPKKFRCIFNRCGIYRFAIMTESGSTGGGLACVIVLWRPELTPKPQLDWSAGKPQFRCSRAEDAGEPVDVYFTTDGSCPWPHRESVRVARAGQPIKLPPSTSLDQTICIRAVAISQHRLASQLLTEFCQIDSSINGANDDGEPEQADSAQLTVTAPMGVLTNQWLWFNSIATIRLVEVADGTIEVFWRKSAVPVSHSVYHLLVNGARWASGEPSNCCYRLGGLAAGREYTIQVVAAIADSATNSTQTGCYPDLLSNELRYNCPSWSTERGPLISMELLADAEDSAAVVWAALPLSRTSALIGYKVSLNGLQCGRLVTPEADGQRCRVVIEGCELNRKHSLMVNAVWTDQTGETFELPSNRLQFRLPLPKPLTAASEVDAAAAAATSESLLLFEGVCEHQQVLAAAQAEAAADKIAAEERESRSKQQEQEKQNQEEDRSKQNGEKLAKKTDEQNKSEAKNKKEKPKQKNQQKQKKENEDKKTEAKEVAKTEEGRSNNGKERKESADKSRKISKKGGRSGAGASASRLDSIFEPVEGESETDLALPGAAMLLLPAPLSQQQSNDSELQQQQQISDKTSFDKPPTPRVRVMPVGSDRVRVAWEFDSMSANLWRHLRSTVSVAGRRFRQEGGGGGGEAAGSGGEAESQGAARRSWSCGPAARELVCGGLETGCDYIIHVISAFAAVENSSSLGERISRSAPVAFKAGSTASVPLTSAGNDVDASQKASSSKQKVQMLQKEQQQPPPIPQPRLFAVSSGPNRVAVRWAFDESAATSGVELAGYQLLINGARRGGLLPSQTSQTTLEPLRPGRTIRVAVQAAAFVSSSSGEDGRVGENEDDDFRLGPASATLRVACPRRPSAPEPSVSPAPASAGVAGGAAATVSWAGAPDDAGVSRYRVYVDGQWHGDLKASPSRGNYFYYLSDLQPGLACEVQVKAIAGSDEVDPQSDTVTCLCESELSQPPLRVTGASVTQSPELKLEALDSDGLTVAWDPLTPESGISGYQILRDGRPYGQPIPANQLRFRVDDLPAGGRVSLQLVAMTTGAERCAPGPVLLVNCAAAGSGANGGSNAGRRSSSASSRPPSEAQPAGVTFRPTTAANLNAFVDLFAKICDRLLTSVLTGQ